MFSFKVRLMPNEFSDNKEKVETGIIWADTLSAAAEIFYDYYGDDYKTVEFEQITSGCLAHCSEHSIADIRENFEW